MLLKQKAVRQREADITNTPVKEKVRERREKKRREGWYRTFLQTHVYHARLAQLQEEVLVFLILLIVNNFHVNYFAARGTITGWGRGEGAWKQQGQRRTERMGGKRERRRKSEKKVNL